MFWIWFKLRSLLWEKHVEKNPYSLNDWKLQCELLNSIKKSQKLHYQNIRWSYSSRIINLAGRTQDCSRTVPGDIKLRGHSPRTCRDCGTSSTTTGTACWSLPTSTEIRELYHTAAETIPPWDKMSDWRKGGSFSFLLITTTLRQGLASLKTPYL